MNREELKQHITNFRLNLPQGIKFAVMAQSAAVLESSQDLECDYLYVAMERPGVNWARLTYGEMESRLEPSWIGGRLMKVYPCYNEEQVVQIDGVPCQYTPSTNPFQDDPMVERPVPKLDDYADHTEAMQGLESDEYLAGLRALWGKPGEFLLDAQGPIVASYTAGIVNLGDEVTESRSASKSLLQKPISLKDTPHGEMQAYLRKPGVTRNKLPEAHPLSGMKLITDPPTPLEMSMRLHEEEQRGGQVQDVQSDIFELPFHFRPTNADFDGDTPFVDSVPRHKLPTRVRMLREFNNMSLTEKNKVRKIRKNLSKASAVSARIASTLRRNMKKLRDK